MDAAEPVASYKPPAPTLRRLTEAQYKNTIADVLGADIVLGEQVEPDSAIADFVSVGASQTSISSRGVGQYEAAAYDIAQQLTTGDAHRTALAPCVPTGAADMDCAKKALGPLGRRLYRRPLTDDEMGDLLAIFTQASGALSDFWGGLQFSIATLLQSPEFLFRAELGKPDPATGQAVYGGYDMASRLSFFLWNGPPDAALLDAAASGGLDTPAGIATQVTRMLASPLAHRGLRNFVTEWLSLDALDDLVKDPMIYTQASSDLGPAAREETLRDFERIVFDLDSDVRDILTTRDTFVNRKLASLYGIRAPSQSDFALTHLPDDQPRRGLLGQASTLAMYSHPTTTSPTERGKFVRTLLLCEAVPPPPVNLNTAIPAPTATEKTMRQRLTVHSTNAFCANCHKFTDPIGLGLESFDGLGVYRLLDQGEPIDASGDLDGTPWSDASTLAQTVHDHPALGPCIARRAYRYASGHEEQDGEAAELKWLSDSFQSKGYKLKQLVTDIAKSEGFRRTGNTTAGN